MSRVVTYRYRYRTPTRKGRWHDSRDKAMKAAVKAKVAHYDEQDGRIYLDVFTEIEREEKEGSSSSSPATEP